MSANQTISLSRGLPLAVEFEFTSDDFGDVPVDLTGCTVSAAIRPSQGEDPKTDLDCTITDAAAGLVLVELDEALTALFPKVSHVWDLVVTDSAGITHATLTGLVEISDNATASL